MQTNWKFIVPIVIVVLVIVAIMMSMRDETPVIPVTPTPPIVEEQSTVVTSPIEAPTPPSAASVTGDVDDMVGVLTNEANGDATVASDVAGAAATVKNDTQEVNSLTTTYDETTF